MEQSQLTFIQTSSNPNESFYIIPTLLDTTLNDAINLILKQGELHCEHGEIKIILPNVHITTESIGTINYNPYVILSYNNNVLNTTPKDQLYHTPQNLFKQNLNKTVQLATAYNTYGNRTDYVIHLNQDNLSK